MSQLTQQEFEALASVLSRAPALPAEVLSLQAIMAKLQPPAPAAPRMDHA